jgi:hypothetical protein
MIRNDHTWLWFLIFKKHDSSFERVLRTCDALEVVVVEALAALALLAELLAARVLLLLVLLAARLCSRTEGSKG